MSELVPFFDEDEVLDDNLLRSIETLLDENEHASNGLNREQTATPANSTGMHSNATTPTTTPTSPTMGPQFPLATGSFSLGNQVYQKWSTNESGEHQATNGMKRNYTGRNHQSRPMNHAKPGKKNTLSVNALQAMRASAEIAQYQAMLAEKANQLLTQYLRLNYEHLYAQAQILGIPLEQYIRNLLIALNNPSFLVPPQPYMFPTFNPMFMTMPSQSPLSTPSPPSTPSSPSTPAPQRAWQSKQFFSKKNWRRFRSLYVSNNNNSSSVNVCVHFTWRTILFFFLFFSRSYILIAFYSFAKVHADLFYIFTCICYEYYYFFFHCLIWSLLFSQEIISFFFFFLLHFLIQFSWIIVE